MNTDRINHLVTMFDDTVKDQERYLRLAERAKAIVTPLLAELTDTCSIWTGGANVLINVYNREDLTVCMTLARQWKKQPSGSKILYWAEEGTALGGPIYLYASDSALPPTCKVVEEEEVIPARPEEKRTRKVIKCDFAETTTG
jgi:hypothetical protein